MTNPDPKRVEVVARAMVRSRFPDIDPEEIGKSGHPVWDAVFGKMAESAIRALDAHDAANGITRVRSLGAANTKGGSNGI